MDTRHPHSIVPTFNEIPQNERQHYVPLSKEKAQMLIAMTPEQRGAWLKEHPIDADVVERIRREEGRSLRRLRRVTEAAEQRERDRVARGMKDGTL